MQDIYRMTEERSSREFAPEGEFDKQAWAERKQSERQEAFDRADAAALRANSDPAALETYMRVAAQLPHHSATNILLIADRMPNATRVGTAEHWRRQGASVRRRPHSFGTFVFRCVLLGMRYNSSAAFSQRMNCGRRQVVRPRLPKPVPRVRVPSPAPAINEGHRRLSVPFDFSLADVQF